MSARDIELGPRRDRNLVMKSAAMPQGELTQLEGSVLAGALQISAIHPLSRVGMDI